MSEPELLAVALHDPLAAGLVADLERDLRARYDDDGAAGVPLDPAAFAPPRGTFLVAVLDGRPVACGGLRPHAPGVGELKRMYVDPQVRGRGLARTVLAGLEDAGVRLGLRGLVLATGLRQPEAIALYAGAGWQRVPGYGEWRDHPLTVCFGKPLAP